MTRATGGKRPARRSTILGAGNPAEAAPQDAEAAGADQATGADSEQASASGGDSGSAPRTAKSSSRASASTGKTGKGRRRGATSDAAGDESTSGSSAAADPPAEDGDDSRGGGGGKAPKVLTPASVGDGQRVSLILHPEDAEMLQLARVKDKADANVRIRAMLACYRADRRLQAKVDRLARAARERPRTR